MSAGNSEQLKVSAILPFLLNQCFFLKNLTQILIQECKLQFTRITVPAQQQRELITKLAKSKTFLQWKVDVFS